MSVCLPRYLCRYTLNSTVVDYHSVVDSFLSRVKYELFGFVYIKTKVVVVTLVVRRGELVVVHRTVSTKKQR